MPSSKLVKNLSPEEEELQRKKEELAALEDQLAELELDLETVLADVSGFRESVNAAPVGKTLPLRRSVPAPCGTNPRFRHTSPNVLDTTTPRVGAGAKLGKIARFKYESRPQRAFRVFHLPRCE